MTWIQTNSIAQFFPLDPRVQDVNVKDIIHSLSHLCRYNGHSNKMYTVGHHSIMVAKIVQKLGGTLEEVKWGLAHDFGEAYCGDLPSPIKNHPTMVAFRDMENKIVAAIAEKIGLVGPEPALVKKVDRCMITFEAASEYVFSGLHEAWPFGPAPEDIKQAMADIGGFNATACMEPQEVRATMTSMFNELFPEMAVTL